MPLCIQASLHLVRPFHVKKHYKKHVKKGNYFFEKNFINVRLVNLGVYIMYPIYDYGYGLNSYGLNPYGSYCSYPIAPPVVHSQPIPSAYLSPHGEGNNASALLLTCAAVGSLAGMLIAAKRHGMNKALQEAERLAQKAIQENAQKTAEATQVAVEGLQKAAEGAQQHAQGAHAAVGEIKKSVEGIYGVDVLSVNVIRIPSKKRRLGKTEGFRKAYKKAIVTIKEGQKIEIL